MSAEEERTKILKDRIAIVTGAASGIGRAVSEELARAGALVCLLDVEVQQGQAVAAGIEDAGGEAHFYECDVKDSTVCQNTVERIEQSYGGIHILVNAAGVIRRATILETTEEEWEHVIGVNLTGVYLMCKSAIPAMARAGGGAIVNLSSGWGHVAGRNAAAYCASKGGVELLTKAMALDHAGDQVRVNTVCPGDTDTPMLRIEASELGVPYESFMEGAADVPMGRVGEPMDIAQAVLFLVSDAASFITGTSLVVDGGGLAGTW